MYTKEQWRVYMKKYRQENAEKLREYDKQRRQSPQYKKMNSKCQKKYYEAHKSDPEYMAKRSAYHAEWQRKNKDILSAYRKERRRKMKGGAES